MYFRSCLCVARSTKTSVLPVAMVWSHDATNHSYDWLITRSKTTSGGHVATQTELFNVANEFCGKEQERWTVAIDLLLV